MAKRTSRRRPVWLWPLIAAIIIAIVGTVAMFYLRRRDIAVLQPRGTIGQQERQLLIIASLLSLVVVVPLFALLFVVSWRYREGNTKSKYTPDADNSRLAETIWWGVPGLLILILSVFVWNSSHKLDPYRPIAAAGQPSLTVQVVALDWKWLFIYPKQGVASVNMLALPVNEPVTFDITADAPMNSFWIPQLGGQVYAMPGMSTQLHLEASKPGTYRGVSANISGDGFAGMHFSAQAMSASSFDAWLQSAHHSPDQLTTQAYTLLAKPSSNMPPTTYASVAPGLYDTIIMKYMMPMSSDSPMPSQSTPSSTQQPAMPGMEMSQ